MGDNAAVETIFGLIFLLPYLIGPALVIALLVVAAPILRRRRVVSRRRRTAAIILSVLCLFRAFQLIGRALDLGGYGVVLMVSLITSAVLTVVQIRRSPTDRT